MLIALVVLAVSGGLFAIQYGQALAECTQLPRPDTCAFTWPPQVAVNAVFASAAGLLAAVVMAITVGVNARRDPAPNVALALQLEDEERQLEAWRERKAEYDGLMALAAERRAEEQAHAEELAEAALEAQAEAEMAAALSGAGGPWQEEEQTPEATLEQKRREAMAERLRQLAKDKPDAVAEVVKGWINQPVR